MSQKHIVFFLPILLMFVFPSIPFAGDSPEGVKLQANNDAQVASRLSNQARQMLQGDLNRERLQTAAELYAQAGQLFEKAMKTYQALGPQYATADEVQNSYNAMQQCIKMIGEIKKRLQS